MTRQEFEHGDLVRVRNEKHPEQVRFARVFRVHQSWLELAPGEHGCMRRDAELVGRERREDFGFVALSESQLVSLAHVASAVGEPSAAALWAEVERIKRLPWRQRESCEDAS